MNNSIRISLLLTWFYLFFNGCRQSNMPDYADDVHSFARPNEAVIKHIDLDLTVDFTEKRISGLASLTIHNYSGTNEIWLDTRGLIIKSVTLDQDKKDAGYTLGDEVQFLGQPLVVKISPHTKSVNISYETGGNATALQWLTPEQTTGGKYPFLFTQSQAIHARSWIPCQDSPGIRFTYSATIRTPSDLMAVMSAENGTAKNTSGIYHFKMKQPIPSYLLALAIGDLRYRSISKRSGVYAEPGVLDKAAKEFADTEKMLSAAEKLYGPYLWGKYDVIVLPPSFPYGGMENPRLTFVTPTILAGDKSLTAMIAHEIAHSWSGNLVTNATWNDLWLNEGFTTYFENRIMAELYGKSYADMLAAISYQDMMADMNDPLVKTEDTSLHQNLQGRDPDEAPAGVIYDKGHFFLRTIEKTIGREKWDVFLNTYFQKFAFQTMTTDKFVAYLQEELLKNNKDLETTLQIDTWIYRPGVPDNVALVHSDEFARVDAQIQSWLNGTLPQDLQTENWTTQHWQHFLRNLPENLEKKQMAALDAAFGFSKTGNAEIKYEWFLPVIANQYEPAYPALEDFLTSIGRRKFLKPLYTKMAKRPETLGLAKFIYQKARSKYHPISTDAVDKILNWND